MKIITAFLLMLCMSSFATTFDTSLVVFNAKMNIVSFDNSMRTEIDYIGLIKSKCKYQFINSKGFNDIVFFKIIVSYNIENNDEFSKIINLTSPYNYSFIFGYNLLNHKIYRLKGFLTNDFYSLFDFLHSNTNPEVLNSKKIFCNNFFVQDLDLECLYDSNEEFAKKKHIKFSNECVQPAKPIFNGNSW